jgi:hypothetical protein
MTQNEVKKLWANDLRANADKQGKNFLNKQDKEFCCWGRLCELAVQHGVITDKTIDKDGYISYVGDAFGPTFKLSNWVGISQFTTFDIGDQSNTLMNYNDSGVSFHDIADAIERSIT